MYCNISTDCYYWWLTTNVVNLKFTPRILQIFSQAVSSIRTYIRVSGKCKATYILHTNGDNLKIILIKSNVIWHISMFWELVVIQSLKNILSIKIHKSLQVITLMTHLLLQIYRRMFQICTCIFCILYM